MEKKPSVYSETYMNLNEPVYQDSMGDISEMLGQVSIGKRVV